MSKLNKEVVDRLRMPIWNVWSGIAPDAMSFVGDDYEAMEMVLGFLRQTEMFGEPEANRFAEELFREHGFADVCKFLSKELRLYYNS